LLSLLVAPSLSESPCLSHSNKQPLCYLLCLSDHLNPPSLVLGILGQLSWPCNKLFLLPFLTIAKLPSPFLPPVHCALGPFRSPHLRLSSVVLWFCCHSSNRRLLRSSSSLTTVPLALALHSALFLQSSRSQRP
jgi:hypothetical protein